MKIEKPIVFFDLETTGVNTSTDRIVQIAILKINTEGEQETANRLINPGRPIPKAATDVHGITDEMVKDAPTFKQIAKSLFDIFDGCDVGGYNSDNFDVPLLIEEFNRAEIEYPAAGAAINFVAVLKLERKVNSHKLTDTYKRYTGKELDGAHDALNDVRATAEVLFEQMAKFKEPMTAAQIDEYCQGEAGRFDYAGKMYVKDDVVCWAFGKHKDKPVTSDRQYADWVMRSDFPLDTKNKLKTVLNG
ncbi:DNA polymerase [Croceibacter phage P2559S]|uniref:DNA polymerase n=1 Tax=Croceibacter phage P2559S TaxID=1176422 RepID=UPI0002688F23|nr:DNA polymerase [Croceibacter phage P2559S]AFM54839.1 DNA polymerase III epsilon subunit [Croceibacter phage P2559S]